MTPEERKHELTTRQMFVGSSMVVKLNAEGGKWFYKIHAWIAQGQIDNKSVVLQGKYNGEDPEQLIKEALRELGLRKLKLGVPYVQ